MTALTRALGLDEEEEEVEEREKDERQEREEREEREEEDDIASIFEIIANELVETVVSTEKDTTVNTGATEAKVNVNTANESVSRLHHHHHHHHARFRSHVDDQSERVVTSTFSFHSDSIYDKGDDDDDDDNTPTPLQATYDRHLHSDNIVTAVTASLSPNHHLHRRRHALDQQRPHRQKFIVRRTDAHATDSLAHRRQQPEEET
jgi:hypothetical protein